MLRNDPLFKPTQMHGHQVPGIWQYMLPQEVLHWKLPEERRSTCMSCPRIITDHYRPDYRCCTYQPSVPNYALGLALQTPSGEKPVRKLIEGGFVLPEGSLHTPQEWYQYLKVTSSEKFGNNETVLCPLLDPATGFCNIYAFRNSVCSTFYCLHDHGNSGSRFWDRMQELVGQVEAVLQQWALVEVGFDLDRYFATLNRLSDNLAQIPQKGGGWTIKARKQLWGDWFGKETDLLLACAKAISENRKDLWTIANEFSMREAEAFERRQIEMVPVELKDEVDESDTEEGEAVPSSVLFTILKRAYRRLWIVPDRRLILNRRVEINENPVDDKESKHFKHRPYELLFLNKKDPDTYDWRLFLTEEDAYLLHRFKRPRQLNKSLLKRLEQRQIHDPAGKIAEWIGQKVLIEVKD